MQIDIKDILANTFSRMIFHAVLFLLSVWIGSMIGGFALVAGVLVESGWLDVSIILSSPLLLISAWLIPNGGVILIGVVYFVMAERVGFAAWGVIAGLQSLFAVLGWVGELEEVAARLAAWATWLVVLIMFAAGLWLWRQMLTNRWARQLAALHAENAARQAEMEQAERERIRGEMER